MFHTYRTKILLLVFLFCFSNLLADVTLPSIISNYMVIQQNSKVPIWGWADKNEIVKVTASWDNKTYSARVDKNDKWSVTLNSPKAGGSHEITIEGKNRIIINDILVGEVWLASGQSNMAFPLLESENGSEVTSAANYSDIRLFHIDRTHSEYPLVNCTGKWVKCSSETAGSFSAVAYYFGKEIHEKLNVPVGLISSSKGGSPIESWIGEEALMQTKEQHAVYDLWEDKENKYPDIKKDYLLEIEKWEKEQLNKSSEEKSPKPEMPVIVKDIEIRHHRKPSYLYNAMIAPIIPYTIKGVIWYQGANNISRWDHEKSKILRPLEYRVLFPLLISQWREQWDVGYFPFYFVQHEPYDYGEVSTKASLLRESQLLGLKVPNTGMVVTVDLGDIHEAHPKNKRDVGKRLALWALAKDYGFNDLVYSGPLFREMKIEKDKVRIYFDYAESGLVSKDSELNCFEIAGKDKKFYEAKAKIEDSTIVVECENVKNPQAVRFSWQMTMIPNLYNKEGLPAAPFRTDNWSIVKEE